MKKKALIYGNCQHTHLERMLGLSKFKDYFDFVSVPDVYCKSKTNLDDETLASVDLFIYQHVSRNFDPFFCTDSIIERLGSKAELICIPNFWFSGYHPQNTKNPIKRRNSKFSISPSGIFPYGDKYIIEALQNDKSIQTIKRELSSPDFISQNDIEQNIMSSIDNLRDREKLFGVTIKSTDFILNNFKKTQLCYSVNHPTKEYFLWLVNELLDYLDIKSDATDIKYYPFTKNHIHVPLYPALIKCLGIDFVSSNPSDKQYLFYNQAYSFEDYLEYYSNHSTFGDINGKDIIDEHALNKINNEDITAITSSLEKTHKNSLESIYSKQNVFPDHNLNYIYYGESLYSTGPGWFKDKMPGLDIFFRGSGNKVYLNDLVTFKDSVFLLGDSCYINIEKSHWSGLIVNNRSHSGGVLYIGENCIGGGGLKIDILGNNKCFISKNVIFSDQVYISCSDGFSILDNQGRLLNPNKNVFIGESSRIGARVIINKGSEIGDFNIVAPGSLVTHETPSMAKVILAGNPATLKEKGINWKISNPDKFQG